MSFLCLFVFLWVACKSSTKECDRKIHLAGITSVAEFWEFSEYVKKS